MPSKTTDFFEVFLSTSYDINITWPCMSATRIWTLLSIIISRKCWICINKSWLNLASSCLWSICSKSNFSKSGFGIGWQIFLESHGNTSVKPRTKSSLTLEKLHSFNHYSFSFSQDEYSQMPLRILSLSNVIDRLRIVHSLSINELFQ